MFNWVSKKGKSIGPCGTAPHPGISRVVDVFISSTGYVPLNHSHQTANPLLSRDVKSFMVNRVKCCREIEREICPLGIKCRSATKAVSSNVLAWLQPEPRCHSRNTASGKPHLGREVTTEAIQLWAIQMLLRKSSQQTKPRETNLKKKNQEINAVLFTVFLW